MSHESNRAFVALNLKAWGHLFFNTKKAQNLREGVEKVTADAAERAKRFPPPRPKPLPDENAAAYEARVRAWERSLT